MNPNDAREASGPPERPRRVAAAAILISASVVFSCSYFFTGGGWNQAAHLDLVRALVTEGRIEIDSFHENTGDKSRNGDHYYSNKAPGTSFFALPFVAGVHALGRALGADEEDPELLLWEARTATFASATLPTAAAAVALFLLALRFGFSLRAAGLGALAFGLGTPAWAYGTLFWAHALATGCLLTAFLLAVLLEDRRGPRADLLLSALTGLAAGWATITEYQAFGAAVLIAFMIFWRTWKDGHRRTATLALGLALGGLLPAILLGVYNHAAFGSPFRLSYTSVVNFAEGHSEGFLGVTYPKLDVLIHLLFGPRLGIFVLAPVLLAAPWGAAKMARHPHLRVPLLFALLVFVYYWLFNSAFYYWWGGWSYGPRLLAPGMAFLSMGLAAAWEHAGRRARTLLLGLGAFSILQTLAAVATHPMPPDTLAFPLRDLTWPSFLQGKLSQNAEPLLTTAPAPSHNVGERLGFRGWESLVPLIIGWILLNIAWLRLRGPTSSIQKREGLVPPPGSGTLPPETPTKGASAEPSNPSKPVALLLAWSDRLEALSPKLCVSAGLIAMLVFALPGLTTDSMTYDEVVYVPVGYSYLVTGDFRMNPEHPPLAKMLAGLPLIFMDVPHPSEDVTWHQRDQWAFGYRYFHQSRNDPDVLLRTGRWMTLFWGMILATSIYAVARDRFGNLGGCLALLLTVACPTVVAHSHYATLDVLAAVMIFLSAVAFQRWLEVPTLRRAAETGILIGGALLTKHSALLLPFILGGMAVLRWFGRPSPDAGSAAGWRTYVTAACMPLAAVLVIWGVYQFRWEASPAGVQLPWDRLLERTTFLAETVKWMRETRLLPEAYLYGIAETDRHAEVGHPAYALGLTSDTGWWWYYPLAFLVKTPVSSILLTVWSLIGLFRRGPAALRRDAALLAAPAAFALAALFSRINIGFRYMLPALPFILAFSAGVLAGRPGLAQPRAIALGLTLAAVLECLIGLPSLVGYVNLACAAVADPHEVLADSNVDWGQDLGRLKQYMDQNGVEEIKLSYFGTASPRHLGLKHQVLPGYALYSLHEGEWPPAGPLRPGDMVAVSTTNLTGVYLEDKLYYWRLLYDLHPTAKVGSSILVYKIPP